MLVVAPHQDDWSSVRVARSLQVREKEPPFRSHHYGMARMDMTNWGLTRQGLVSLRNEESRRACAMLSIEPRFLSRFLIWPPPRAKLRKKFDK